MTAGPSTPVRRVERGGRLGQRLVRLAAGLFVLAFLSATFDTMRLGNRLVSAPRPQAVTLLDRERRLMLTLGDGFAQPLRIEQVSPWLRSAVVAIEDRRFYEHLGIDPLGILRALARNLVHGGVAEGGSTITQQLAKLAFLGPERTLLRKIREAGLALWLDTTFSKDEILAAYLDRVYLGAGMTGVRAASRRYFGMEAENLGLAQAIVLAGMLKAPSRLEPTRDPALARERAAVVLGTMVETGAIDQDQADEVRSRPAKILPVPLRDASLRSLTGDARDAAPDAGALVARTTLDVVASQAARTILLDELAKSKRGASAAALLMLAPDGDVLVATSVPGELDGADRSRSARRQPGSAFKPIVFAAALEAGHRPDEPISTGPIVVDGWRPANISPPEAAALPLGTALAESVNTSAVRLAMAVGLDRVVALGHAAGIDSELPKLPSIALGSAEVGMLELATAFATLSGDGQERPPRTVISVRTEDGHDVAVPPAKPRRVVSAETAAALRGMLALTMTEGTGQAAAIPGGYGKTGTTSGYRDAWFVGGTPAGNVIVVWAGNDDGSPTKGMTGGDLPARIFKRFATGR